MSFKGVKYEFEAEPWQYSGQGGWHFVSLPQHLSVEIRNTFKHEEEGWGRLKATSKIGKTEWKTSIWFDSKKGTYILPLKAEIRNVENLAVGKKVNVITWI